MMEETSEGVAAHEIAHQFKLADSYGLLRGSGEGVTGSPPRKITTEQVNEIIRKSLKKKVQ